jgi:hypothetical protein
MVAGAIGRITFGGFRWALEGSCDNDRPALRKDGPVPGRGITAPNEELWSRPTSPICQNRHNMRCGDARVKTFLVAPHRTGDLQPARWLRGDGD